MIWSNGSSFNYCSRDGRATQPIVTQIAYNMTIKKYINLQFKLYSFIF